MIGGGEDIPRGPALSCGIPRRSSPRRSRAPIACGTGLLLLPIARSGPGGAGVLEALFTATSAVCVTGLVVVDTPVYWSGFGQAVILVLIQVGGFGIMTLASIVGLLISRRLGLRSRLIAAAETKHTGLADLRGVVIGVAKVSLLFEAVTALLLTARFLLGYQEPPLRALYLGVFHAVSSFNNAGFALFSDNLIGFVDDPWICLPISAAVISGGLGFPVLFELRRRWRRPREWSLHTRLTCAVTVVLLVAGTRLHHRVGVGQPGDARRLEHRRIGCWPGSSPPCRPARPASTVSTSPSCDPAPCWALMC